jgi:hypothetical protein
VAFEQGPNVLVAGGSYRQRREPVSGTLVHVARRLEAPLLCAFELKPPR